MQRDAFSEGGALTLDQRGRENNEQQFVFKPHFQIFGILMTPAKANKANV